jgi:hypothetical protein
MQPLLSTAQVITLPLTQVLPAPVQSPGAAGHLQAAVGALPWQVSRPGQAMSLLQVRQAPTATQVSMPPAPHLWSPATQALWHPASVELPPSRPVVPAPGCPPLPA